ncbi:MAG: hypothetical protein DRP82_03270 [Planctomycetota bacterium]|nr:MAG: hypothetical protein DRP82_03270 [Planctomycetota bacterium]
MRFVYPLLVVLLVVFVIGVAFAGHWEVKEVKVWIPGHYEKVWVPPVYKDVVINNRLVRIKLRNGYWRVVWIPGHWKVLKVWVWVDDD